MARSIVIPRQSRPLYAESQSGDSWHAKLLKARLPNGAQSNQEDGLYTNSTKQQPFNMASVKRFLNQNEHHSTCILTKARATVGLGFKTPSEIKKDKEQQQPGEVAEPASTESEEESRISEVLNPLCKTTFKDILDANAEDYHNIGNAYIECVRGGDGYGPIEGLFYAQGECVWIKEQEGQEYFEVQPDGGVSKFHAPFGQKEEVVELLKLKDPRKVSELIHLPKVSSLSRWYGYPDWLSATASVELVQMITQHHFDFHQNRGVPELAAFFTGAHIDDKDWQVIEDAFKSNIGLGNSHKSVALNLPQPNLEIDIQKLAMEGKGQDPLSDQLDALAMRIVTAHRVPPLLAGIQIPGKLGATNELPNALMAFQSLVIGPAQDSILAILRKTLGDSSLSGLDLKPDDFVLRKITDVIDVAKADTVSRMRQTVPEAEAEGRKIEEGLKKALDHLSEEERSEVISSAVADLLMRLAS